MAFYRLREKPGGLPVFRSARERRRQVWSLGRFLREICEFRDPGHGVFPLRQISDPRRDDTGHPLGDNAAGVGVRETSYPLDLLKERPALLNEVSRQSFNEI